MACGSGSMEYWRKFFRSANCDIFEVIENAILVAASDWPQEFRLRRDQIAERIFTCQLAQRRLACDDDGVLEDHVEDEEDEDHSGMKRDGGGKESKVGSSNDVPDSELHRMVSNYSYDEAEALTEEMEEQSQIVGEVYRIKGLLSSKEESSNVLFESLRRLQLMRLSVETLKATEIGKAVNGLRKHNSKEIRQLVRTLIDGWKVLVDEWVNTTPAIPGDSLGNSPESVNPSTVDEEEEGLPSPPMDEGALLATHSMSFQLSEFFDGMDDDGNPRAIGDYDKKQENGRRSHDNHKPVKQQQQPPRHVVIPEDRRQNKRPEPVVRQTKPQESVNGRPKPHDNLNRQSRTVAADSGPGRPARLAFEQKSFGEIRPRNQQNPVAAQRKPISVTHDKSKFSEDASVRAKLEAAKRKLHEGYQQAENAKKQRTIQVMEIHDLPKQGHSHRHPVMKPKSGIRSWANGGRR